MDKPKLNLTYLDDVLNDTIEAVEKGQCEIVGIYEHAKQECERLEQELAILKEQVKATIKKVDYLERLEKSSKYKLMLVSREFEKYSEEDIHKAYEEAKDVQIQLTLAQQMEITLREKRDELERSFKSISKNLKHSEHLSMQLGVALNFLKGNLEDISDHLMDMRQKQKFAAQIIKAQEEERKRVAREIHDGPAQTMANIVIQSEICEKLFEKDVQAAKEELDILKKVTRSSLEELRKIIFDLRPAALDDLGLLAVTQRYCSDFQENTGILTDFVVLGNKIRLDPNIEVALFRIIQEGLNNVKKHSKANNVTVKIECLENIVNLNISDDGCGFDMDKNGIFSSGNHFGLMSIKERAELFGGSINIDSILGCGTKLYISIPL